MERCKTDRLASTRSCISGRLLALRLANQQRAGASRYTATLWRQRVGLSVLLFGNWQIKANTFLVWLPPVLPNTISGLLGELGNCGVTFSSEVAALAKRVIFDTTPRGICRSGGGANNQHLVKKSPGQESRGLALARVAFYVTCLGLFVCSTGDPGLNVYERLQEPCVPWCVPFGESRHDNMADHLQPCLMSACASHHGLFKRLLLRIVQIFRLGKTRQRANYSRTTSLLYIILSSMAVVQYWWGFSKRRVTRSLKIQLLRGLRDPVREYKVEE